MELIATIAGILLLGAGAVWALVREGKSNAASEANLEALKNTKEANDAAAKIMEQPVADESAWLKRARDRVRDD